MQLTSVKSQQILYTILIILGLSFYFFFAHNIFGNNFKFIFIPIVVLAGTILLLTLPLPRIFQVFIITLPLDSTLVINAGFTIQPSFLLLLFMIFIMFLSREFWVSKSPLDYAIFAYLAVCTLSLIQIILTPPPTLKLSENMGLRGNSFRSFIQISLLYFFSLSYFFTVHICRDKKNLDLAIKTYIVVGIIVASYGIYQAFASQFNLPLKSITNGPNTGGGSESSGLFVDVEFASYRSQSTFGEPLGFGHYLLSLIPISLVFTTSTRGYYDFKNHKWLTNRSLFIITTIFFLALFMTRSRGALIGFSASMVVIPLLLGTENIKKFIIYIIITLSILAILYLLAVKYMGLESDILKVLRFKRSYPVTGLYNEDESFNPLRSLFGTRSQRYLFYAQWIPYFFKRHPILGLGIGNFTIFLTGFLNRDVLVSPQGVIGTVIAETGILGFTAFSAIIIIYYITMIKTLIKVRKTNWAPYLIGLTASFTGIMVQYLSFGARLNVYTWFIMGISMALINIIRREQNIGNQNQVTMP
jgi:hypothetical protein